MSFGVPLPAIENRPGIDSECLCRLRGFSKVIAGVGGADGDGTRDVVNAIHLPPFSARCSEEFHDVPRRTPSAVSVSILAVKTRVSAFPEPAIIRQVPDLDRHRIDTESVREA
jgi:hypothetical protein